MKSGSGGILFIIISLSGVLLTARPAHAYLDPGTVSYFLQILIAGLVGLSVTIRLYWSNIISIFKRKNPADNEKPGDKNGGNDHDDKNKGS